MAFFGRINIVFKFNIDADTAQIGLRVAKKLILPQ